MSKEETKNGMSVMTEGSIFKKICIFAVPCILGRILQNLYNLTDSVIVGNALDINALAAVGATGSIISLFTDTIIGLMSGFSVTAAKKYGSKNFEELKKVFFNSLIITLISSIVISVAGAFFARNMLVLMNTPPDILDLATKYLVIIFMGMTATSFYNFLCEMLRALGNSREPLIFLLISSIIHIALILVFLFGFKLGVIGAALSTVISQIIAVVMCGIFIYKRVPLFKLKKADFKLDSAILKECLHIGIPMAVTNFVVMFGVIILSFVTNGIGTEYIAAYSCASKIGYIVTTPIFGFATAASVFVSQNLGAGNFSRIRQGVKTTNITVTLINIILFIAVFFLARPLLEFMIKDSETAVSAGVMYLNIRCASMFVLTLAAVYKSVLTGLGRPLFPTLSGFMEIIVRYVVPITLSQSLGFASVPLTDSLTWLMLALFLTPVYFYEFKKLKKQGENHEKF